MCFSAPGVGKAVAIFDMEGYSDARTVMPNFRVWGLCATSVVPPNTSPLVTPTGYCPALRHTPHPQPLLCRTLCCKGLVIPKP